MRALEITIESRKNPDQNIKRSGRVEAAEFLSKVINTGDNWGVSFTDINKLGINPNTNFSSGALNTGTPAGVYFYPPKYFINMVKESIKFPYGDDSTFIQVFKYEPKNMLILNNAKFKDWDRVVKTLGVEEEDELGWGASIMQTVRTYLENNPSKSTETWGLHRIFRKKLGYDAILDLGIGAIQSNEPYCGVILDTGIIKEKKTFNNIQPKDKTNPTFTAIDPWQKQKIQQPKLTAKYLNPQKAFNYARDVIQGRWYDAEPIIAQNNDLAEEYFLLFVGGDFDEWINSVSNY